MEAQCAVSYLKHCVWCVLASGRSWWHTDGIRSVKDLQHWASTQKYFCLHKIVSTLSDVALRGIAELNDPPKKVLYPSELDFQNTRIVLQS